MDNPPQTNNNKPPKKKPTKGAKSIPWREDPEILRRLDEVEDLVLSGYRNTEIAKHLSVNEITIRRDRERIAILWREQTINDIAAMRARSISNFRRIQRLADNDYRRAKDNDLLDQRPSYLRVQLDAEREIVKLQGTPTPVTQPITFPDAGKAVDALTTADMLQRAAGLKALAEKLLGEQQSAEDTQDQAADPPGADG